MGVFYVLNGGQQHASGTAGWVIDGLALTGVEHLNHQPHHTSRRVELARLLVGGIGKFLDQVLVRIAEQVGVDVVVSERKLGKMLNEVFEQGIRQSVFVRPLGIAKNAIQRVRVSLFDLPHGDLQSRTDIGGFGANVVPVAVLGDLESMRLRKPGQLLVTGFVNDLLVFLVPNVADALEEQQWEDVGLEVGRIHGPAQDVGRFPEVGFNQVERDSFG